MSKPAILFSFGKLLNRLEKVTTARINQILAGMTMTFPDASIVREYGHSARMGTLKPRPIATASK